MECFFWYFHKMIAIHPSHTWVKRVKNCCISLSSLFGKGFRILSWPIAHRITQHFRSCSEKPDLEIFVPLWYPSFDSLRMFSVFYLPSSIPSQEQAKGSSPEAWLSAKSLLLDLEGTVIKIRYKVCFEKDLHDSISVWMANCSFDTKPCFREENRNWRKHFLASSHS